MKTLVSYIFMLFILPACSNKEIKANTELNKSETKADASADLIIREPIGQTLAAAVDHLLKR